MWRLRSYVLCVGVRLVGGAQGGGTRSETNPFGLDGSRSWWCSKPSLEARGCGSRDGWLKLVAGWRGRISPQPRKRLLKAPLDMNAPIPIPGSTNMNLCIIEYCSWATCGGGEGGDVTGGHEAHESKRRWRQQREECVGRRGRATAMCTARCSNPTSKMAIQYSIWLRVACIFTISFISSISFICPSLKTYGALARRCALGVRVGLGASTGGAGASSGGAFFFGGMVDGSLRSAPAGSVSAGQRSRELSVGWVASHEAREGQAAHWWGNTSSDKSGWQRGSCWWNFLDFPGRVGGERPARWTRRCPGRTVRSSTASSQRAEIRGTPYRVSPKKAAVRRHGVELRGRRSSLAPTSGLHARR